MKTKHAQLCTILKSFGLHMMDYGDRDLNEKSLKKVEIMLLKAIQDIENLFDKNNG